MPEPIVPPTTHHASARSAASVYAWSFAALAAAVLLRRLLDPLLGDQLPFVTLFSAVAAAVWVGGRAPGIAVSLVGYVAANYLFIPPRGTLLTLNRGLVAGLLAYLFTCAIIVAFGEAARSAHRRASDLGRGRAGQLLLARRLAAIVESSDDAIISKSLAGIVESWNAGAERIFGYTAEQAVGRHISFLIPPDRIAEEDLIIGLLKVGQRVDHFETERLRSDGQRIQVSLTVSPILDEAGKVVGASKIARDVTEQKRLSDNLRRLASDLAEADRRKNEFLAVLAHELRNPLAPIKNAVRSLRRAPGNREAIEEASQLLERQVGQMSRLVDDLLDMSRITQGRIELRNEPIELAPVVAQAVEAARGVYARMNRRLTVTLPPHPVYLVADPARLTQVIGNLLNNAAKFTDSEGHVQLIVEAHKGQAAIRVKDDGIGIAAEQLPRIFDMFTQVDTSLERTRDGLGIGLTLVKKLVDLQGGSVAACSDGPGRGSEFTVRLPTLAAVPRLLSNSAPAATPPAGKRRVLIVDDSEDGAESLALLLQLEGHETHKAHDGVEAVEAAERLHPDAVLLDIGLPRMNGYEACRRIREQPWAKDLLMVALTGWGQDEDRQQSDDAGFDVHMVKPPDHDELLRLVAATTPRS